MEKDKTLKSSEGSHIARKISRRLSALGHGVGEIVSEVTDIMDLTPAQEKLERILAQPDAPAGHPKTLEADAAQKPRLVGGKRNLLEKLGFGVLEPKDVVLRDKIVFTLSVMNLALSAFWVGKYPTTYYHWWLAKTVVLFTIRYATYRVQKLHYMLFEFCYFAGYVGLYYLYCDPTNAALRKISFAMMAGPLTWVIVALRNSMVLHDADKMTTLMMHASPAVTAWTMRWYPTASWTEGKTPAEVHTFNQAGFKDLVALPILAYLAWLVGYYVLIFCLLSHRIARKGYPNMFSEMILAPKVQKSPLAQTVLKAPKILQPFAYLGIHGFGASLALLPTVLCWNSYWAHTVLLISVLSSSAWFGASFYFKVRD